MYQAHRKLICTVVMYYEASAILQEVVGWLSLFPATSNGLVFLESGKVKSNEKRERGICSVFHMLRLKNR